MGIDYHHNYQSLMKGFKKMTNLITVSKTDFLSIAESTIFDNITAYEAIRPKDGVAPLPLVWFAYNQKSTKELVLNEIGKAQRALITYLKKGYIENPLKVKGTIEIKVVG
jgi:hypothetical protein